MLVDIEQILIQKLQNIDGIEFAYLFGSYANGSFNDRSDVDIALYLKKDNFDMQLDISFDLSRRLEKDVDLVILNKAKNLYLIEDIIQNGIVLKDSDKRFDFELKKHHQFLDFKEFKKRIYVA